MAVTIQTRRDEAADWAAANPTLALGEIGIETDTNKAKYGDGFTLWNDLDYFVDNDPNPGGELPVGTNSQTLRYGTTSWEATSDLVVSDGGNVGIGITEPQKPLHVQIENSGSFPSALRLQNNGVGGNTGVSMTFNWNNDNPAGYLGVQRASNGAATSHMVFATTADYNNIAPTEKMRIDSAGNVGIGTDAPSYQLETSKNANSALWSAVRNLRTGNAATAGVLFGNDNSPFNASIFSASSGIAGANAFGGANSLNVGTYAASPLAMFTGGTERMRIDSSGNLLVGRTDTLLANLGVQFVAGSGRNAAGAFYRGSTNTSNYVLAVYSDIGGTETFVGGAQSGGNWVDASDIARKEDVQPINYGLEATLALNPVNFKWKESEGRALGFIAQEVQLVLPELVNELPDGKLGVSYSHTVPVLVKAIQEQQEQIDELRALIGAK